MVDHRLYPGESSSNRNERLRGVTSISPRALTKITHFALHEIPEVACPNGDSSCPENNRPERSSHEAKPAEVVIRLHGKDDESALRVPVQLRTTAPEPSLSEKIQQSVKETLEQTAGVKVEAVEIILPKTEEA